MWVDLHMFDFLSISFLTDLFTSGLFPAHFFPKVSSFSYDTKKLGKPSGVL